MRSYCHVENYPVVVRGGCTHRSYDLDNGNLQLLAFKASLHWSSGLNSLGGCWMPWQHGPTEGKSKKGGEGVQLTRPEASSNNQVILAKIEFFYRKIMFENVWHWNGAREVEDHLTCEAKWRQDAWLPAHAPALVLANSRHGVSATWLQSSIKLCIIFREQAQASDFTIRLLDSWLFHHLYPWRFQRNPNHAKTAFRWVNLLDPVFNLV